MSYWILQCNINDYAWFDYMKKHEGDPDTWEISRFGDEIKYYDIAFIWLTKNRGKETRGIYAMAKITGLPDPKRKQFDYGEVYWINSEAKSRHVGQLRLEVQYLKIDRPLLLEDLKAANLDDLEILRMPQRGVYKLKEEQGRKIKRMVEVI